jgi:hypothetical protein
MIPMEQQTPAENRPQPFPLWQRIRTGLARLPFKAWIVLGLFLFAALLMAIHTAVAAKDSSLLLKGQHNFRHAQLSVWVDGDLAYSGKLTGSKKFGLVPVQGSISQSIALPSGKHQVRIQVESSDGTVQEGTITGEFSRDAERILSVSAKRTELSLTWQGTPAAVAESPSLLGSVSRYTGTLLVTAAGSIISALAGFALKELPKQLGSRQADTPKV